MQIRILSVATIAALLSVAPALAQKSKDTLRIAFHDPISTVDIYSDRKPETVFTNRAIMERPMIFNSTTNKYQGLLMESWKQVDALTTIFKLRKGVKYHDGTDYDADDMIYTINWAKHPKVRLRGKGSYTWIKSLEKIDSHTVKVVSKRPYAPAFARMSVGFTQLPSHLHGPLGAKQKSDFGRKAVGTGQYKLVKIEPGKSVHLAMAENYNHHISGIPKATIKNVVIRQIGDIQTQIAELITGNLDAIYGVPKDQVAALSANPDLRVTISKTITMLYMAIDSSGRSKHKALQDQRVRKALMLAIDRNAVVNAVIAGSEETSLLNAFCVEPSQVGCNSSTKPAKHDRAAAIKLLTEAGYPNGFDITINSLGVHTLSEAIAGELRKIKVRAKVRKLTFGAFRKVQRQGKQEILVAHFSSGGTPDIASPMGYLFSGTGRDFWRDPVLLKIQKEGEAEMDPVKRNALYRRAMDQINNKNYILPIATSPEVWVHTKDLKIQTDPLAGLGANLSGFSWK